MPKEITTTGAIAGRGTYFPNRRFRKKDKGSPMMNEARLAVKLVERYGLSHRAAVRVVLEGDADGASKMMAANAAPNDPKEQAKLAKDYKEQIKKELDAVSNREREDDKPFPPKQESRRTRTEADPVVPKEDDEDPDTHEDDDEPIETDDVSAY